MKIWLVSYCGDHLMENDVVLIVCANEKEDAIKKAKEKYPRKEDTMCRWTAEEVVKSDEIVEIYA